MTDKDVSHADMVEAVAQQFDVDAEAADFLSQHPHLYPVLLESIETIHSIFGQDSDLSLRLVRDYEIPDSEILYCNIPVALTVDEAMGKMDTFDDQFYIDLPYEVRRDLTFSVRYRK